MAKLERGYEHAPLRRYKDEAHPDSWFHFFVHSLFLPHFPFVRPKCSSFDSSWVMVWDSQGSWRFPFNFSHGLHSWPSPEPDPGTDARVKLRAPAWRLFSPSALRRRGAETTGSNVFVNSDNQQQFKHHRCIHFEHIVCPLIGCLLHQEPNAADVFLSRHTIWTLLETIKHHSCLQLVTCLKVCSCRPPYT